MENKKLCVGIIGCGAIYHHHVDAISADDRLQLVAFADIDDAHLQEAVSLYGGTPYSDYIEMIKKEQLDSVHICTPHYLHFPMIKKALEAGKDVVVEKPVTMTKDEFAELQNLKNVGKVCVVFQNRLNPCVVKLKELIESRELGEIKAARAMLTWRRTKSYYEAADWRGKWATEGGGLLINQAVHTLDYFSYLLGNVKSVKASMSNFTLEDTIEVEDTLAAVLELESGIRGIFFATNGYTENSTPFFEVSFENGVTRYTDKQLWVNGELLAEDTAPVAGKAYWGNGHPGLFKRYYDENMYFTVADAKNTMDTLFAIYEKAGKI